MRLCDILTIDRIIVDADGSQIPNKDAALKKLAELLSPAVSVPQAEVEDLLMERERLQSTGIGDGVAIPHTALDHAEQQASALILCTRGVDFDAIDGKRVHIVFGVVGPKRATGEHLRTLARISRLLRDDHTRARMISAGSREEVYGLIAAHDASEK
ncbi:MAG TPA: PTS sugar transporter subunit IIA [Polyangiaceae bacterium]|nr:PTS sugar transporter subunit IIA [Polyangiaceae bacterium]